MITSVSARVVDSLYRSECYWRSLLVFCINKMGIRVFGEFEFWFCGITIIALVEPIVMGLIINRGRNPQHDRIGFSCWNTPNGPLDCYLISQVHNEKSLQFPGSWSTLTTALFPIATKLIGVTVGGMRNPRKNVPKAIRRMIGRICTSVLYRRDSRDQPDGPGH